jgi:cyclophilin family peptidyl-prolyl cis-trans isomerase
MVAPAPHLNGDYTIFGEAVDGFEVRRSSWWSGLFDIAYTAQRCVNRCCLLAI